jgi:hypothetical protein
MLQYILCIIIGLLFSSTTNVIVCPIARTRKKMHPSAVFYHSDLCEKLAVITHCLPRFHSTPCRSFSTLQHSEWLEPRSSCLGGGGPVEALQLHTTTQSHWSSGSTICFSSRGSALRVLGIHKFTMELGFSC